VKKGITVAFNTFFELAKHVNNSPHEREFQIFDRQLVMHDLFMRWCDLSADEARAWVFDRSSKKQRIMYFLLLAVVNKESI